MKVRELIELLKGKEDYDIDVDYINEIFEVEIDDESETVSFILDDETDLSDCCGNCEYCELENCIDEETAYRNTLDPNDPADAWYFED